jgi:hypothetical protein
MSTEPRDSEFPEYLLAILHYSESVNTCDISNKTFVSKLSATIRTSPAGVCSLELSQDESASRGYIIINSLLSTLYLQDTSANILAMFKLWCPGVNHYLTESAIFIVYRKDFNPNYIIDSLVNLPVAHREIFDLKDEQGMYQPYSWYPSSGEYQLSTEFNTGFPCTIRYEGGFEKICNRILPLKYTESSITEEGEVINEGFIQPQITVENSQPWVIDWHNKLDHGQPPRPCLIRSTGLLVSEASLVDIWEALLGNYVGYEFSE